MNSLFCFFIFFFIQLIQSKDILFEERGLILKECNATVKYISSWQTGFSGQLIVNSVTSRPLTADLDDTAEWRIEVIFSDFVTLPTFYGADLLDFNGHKLNLINQPNNGYLSNTEPLLLDWEVGFESGQQAPSIQGIKLNGKKCDLQPFLGETSTPVPQIPDLSLPISNKVDYSKAIQLSNLFFQAQRSGMLNADSHFSYEEIPYRGDSALTDGRDHGVDLIGGYYQDGGYVKYTFPLAASTTLLSWGLIDFQNGYRQSEEYESALRTVRWATDYLIKCHTAENTLFAQVGDPVSDWGQWTRIEDSISTRPSFKIDSDNPGSDLAAEVSAALSAASMLFAATDFQYAQLLISHAKQLFNFADVYRGKYHYSVPGADIHYGSTGFLDELMWSSVWLYRATGEQQYLSRAELFFQNLNTNELSDFSWDNKTLGALSLIAQITGEAEYNLIVDKYCSDLISRPQTPGGLAMINYPGFNREFQSYMVGYSDSYPLRAQHKSSSCPTFQKCSWTDFESQNPNPWKLWGAVVAGPDKTDQYTDERNNGDQNRNISCNNPYLKMTGFMSNCLSVCTKGSLKCKFWKGIDEEKDYFNI